MKELKPIETIYLEKYDLHVKPFLTLAEIQNIVNNIMQFDTWAEREKTKNLMIFLYATDYGQDEDKVNEIDYDLFAQNEVFDTVNDLVFNTYLVDEALKYSESTMRALYQISEHLPELLAPLQKVVKKRGTVRKSAKK